MKVTKEDYATMREAITDLPEGANERERWDALWRAVDAGRLDYSMFRPYYDDHIDTALRAISRENARGIRTPSRPKVVEDE